VLGSSSISSRVVAVGGVGGEVEVVVVREERRVVVEVVKVVVVGEERRGVVEVGVGEEALQSSCFLSK